MNKYIKHAIGARYIKNDDKLKKSTSGGVFLGIAEYIVEQNGIVYGATYNNDNEVEHTRITTIEDIEKMQGSKYIQSNLKDTFQLVKKDLDNNQLVFFTGTPCQVAGLKCFLEKDYINLYTLDFSCRGVPSSKFFKKYLQWFENKYKEKVKSGDINFRSKIHGWNYRNQKFYIAKIGSKYTYLDSDPYNFYFVRGDAYRRSCYVCHFKEKNSNSDITVGDFNKSEILCPKVNNKKGTSYIIFNSNHGYELFTKTKENFIYEDVDLELLYKYNPNLNRSLKKPKGRDTFYKNINSEEYIEELRKKIPLKHRIKPYIPYSILKIIKPYNDEKQ